MYNSLGCVMMSEFLLTEYYETAQTVIMETAQRSGIPGGNFFAVTWRPFIHSFVHFFRLFASVRYHRCVPVPIPEIEAVVESQEQVKCTEIETQERYW